MASVRKRDPNDPTSPWIVEYTDAAGKRRRQTPKSGLKKDAEAIRKRIEREIAEGEHLAISQSATVRAVCELYLRQQEERWRRGEIGELRYRQIVGIVDNYIVPLMGAKIISALEFRDIEEFHTGMRKDLSPYAAKSYLSSFRRIEMFAKKRRFTAKVVTTDLTEEIGSVPQQPIRTFTLDEVRLLNEIVATRAFGQKKRGNLMLRAMVQLASFCGLRFGEILGLTATDIDLENKVLKIRHSLTPKDLHKTTKTKAGIRDIPLPSLVGATLREWMQSHYIPNERALVFRLHGGRQITPSNFHNGYWRPLLKKANLFNKGNVFHFHALRHFASSAMIHLGIPLPDVASMMGHEKFDMTLQVYAHPIVGGHRYHEGMDRMAMTLSGAPVEAGRDENAPPRPNMLIEHRPQ